MEEYSLLRTFGIFAGGAIASEPVIPIKSAPTNSNPASVFQFSILSGCAAALLCVEEQYCTLEGVISKEPVTLTSSQLLRRVPLSVSDDVIIIILKNVAIL